MSTPFDKHWLEMGACVPVDIETTAALVAEIKRLIDVVGSMALARPEQPAQQEQVACPACGEYEPRTGTCGTSPSDKRALCNRGTSPQAQPSQRTWVELTMERKRDIAESYFSDEWAIERAVKLLNGCEAALQRENA